MTLEEVPVALEIAREFTPQRGRGRGREGREGVGLTTGEQLLSDEMFNALDDLQSGLLHSK